MNASQASPEQAKVERVARAIFDNWTAPCEYGPADFEPAARAAIAAMKDEHGA